jgi:hypothetical protein
MSVLEQQAQQTAELLAAERDHLDPDFPVRGAAADAPEASSIKDEPADPELIARTLNGGKCTKCGAATEQHYYRDGKRLCQGCWRAARQQAQALREAIHDYLLSCENGRVVGLDEEQALRRRVQGPMEHLGLEAVHAGQMVFVYHAPLTVLGTVIRSHGSVSVHRCVHLSLAAD